jgi:7-keto-8-aminopelargonate synthetase-like enzyme
MNQSNKGLLAAEQSVREAFEAGLALQTIGDAPGIGRQFEIDGQTLLNFGSCSYLALDQRPELKRGAIQATERFGTQFSFSRVFLQLPLYVELEQALSKITDGYALVAPSTTLGHIATLPVIVEPGDAVVVDQFAHSSLHLALSVLRSIPIELLPHNDMDLLEEKVRQLVASHRRVWFVLDGLYSMLGDFAPMARIAELLAKYPQLHLYVDDAHCTSWIGKNGRGYTLDQLPDRSRVVVALGFAKAFAVGGAAIVFANDEDRLRVRRCGGPLLFSGPLQPPLLGAAVASAELHLRPDFAALQQSLVERIELAHRLATELGVRFVAKDRTPIVCVRCPSTSVAYALASGMREQGIYVCISAFPAVPRNQSGIRFTLSLHNTKEDIERLMHALSRETKRLGIAQAAHQPGEASIGSPGALG